MKVINLPTIPDLGNTLHVDDGVLQVKKLPTLAKGKWDTLSASAEVRGLSVLLQDDAGNLFRVVPAGSVFSDLGVYLHSTRPYSNVGESFRITASVKNLGTTPVEHATLTLNFGAKMLGEKELYQVSLSRTETSLLELETGSSNTEAGTYSYELRNLQVGAIARLTFDITLKDAVSYAVKAYVQGHDAHVDVSDQTNEASLVLSASGQYTFDQTEYGTQECPLPTVTEVSSGRELVLMSQTTLEAIGSAKTDITLNMVNAIEANKPFSFKIPKDFSVSVTPLTDRLRVGTDVRASLGMFTENWKASRYAPYGTALFTISQDPENSEMVIVTITLNQSAVARISSAKNPACKPVHVLLYAFSPNNFEEADRHAIYKDVLLEQGVKYSISSIQQYPLAYSGAANSFIGETFEGGYYHQNKPREVLYNAKVTIKRPTRKTIYISPFEGGDIIRRIIENPNVLRGLTFAKLQQWANEYAATLDETYRDYARHLSSYISGRTYDSSTLLPVDNAASLDAEYDLVIVPNLIHTLYDSREVSPNIFGLRYVSDTDRGTAVAIIDPSISLGSHVLSIQQTSNPRVIEIVDTELEPY